MHTRSRSAAKAKKEQPKISEVTKEPGVLVIDSDEEDVRVKTESEEDELECVPVKTGRKKAHDQSKKESKPRTRKATPKIAPKKEPKQEQEKLDDLQQDSLYYELSEKEMKEVNHAFDSNHPDDGDELMNSDGLRTAMRSLGFEPRGDEIQRLIKKFSTKKGKINRNGFHKIMSHKYGSSPSMTKENSTNDEISRVFNLLDLDKTGFITLDNLKSIAKELNEDLSDTELMEMITEADGDGDSKIDKEDFHKIMRKTNLY